MRIGDVAQRTGIPARMLRYYEQQGLLESERLPNGYRSYDESQIARAVRVRGLIQAGLSARMARLILDTEEHAGAPECSLALAQQLREELAGIEERLSCLTKSRDAVVSYLERSQHSALLHRPTTA
ncbi:MerR family transcriptional regulator [Pseudactinotalea suaedae]|jgi:DNA-binding transcriptional MerR regulator|uniref:MerR family transcriptional regulator n=1 Tax=Pseudactinotalea suaedae TaxID=1524924 RepID=UPI0012E21CED|nr:MerR family transcriptional regulator [Pseudactinotalea suaedae]